MARSSREEKFLEFRRQFPFFIFEKQEYAITTAGIDVRFTFNLAGQYTFHPTLFIPRKSFFLPDHLITGKLDSIVFNIGMIELISYWKAACPPTIVIRPFALNKDQVNWWKKLYFHGLGEFFYLNSIPATEENFVDLRVETDCSAPLFNMPSNMEDALVIPVGGGKDSVVTLELLGNRPGSIPLIMNPRGASLETIVTKGFSPDDFIEIRRTIDPLLLQLNDRGFLNGHTPFSALLAFVTVLASMLSGRRHIALSNESSANEATIEGTGINHQYSKSFQFESDFRDYVKKWISADINYFSFLRPLNELQIASLFSRFTKYHPVFKSCNAGSKTDSWCGRCGKCLFTCIMLSPFMEEEELTRIFGKRMLADPSLVPVLDQLTGVADEKPFDCVGTISEVNLALCETIRHFDQDELPVLLAHYKISPVFSRYKLTDFTPALFSLSGDHHVPGEFLEILSDCIKEGNSEIAKHG
jgi:hypothetical protein